jgi:hypothetical protein
MSEITKLQVRDLDIFLSAKLGAELRYWVAPLRYWDREFHNSRIMKLAIQLAELAELAVGAQLAGHHIWCSIS